MQDFMANKINNYKKFEECVAKIFDEADFVVTQNVWLADIKREIDIVVEKDENKFYVEVKYTQIRDLSIRQVYEMAELCKMKPILVTAHNVDENRREHYKKKYPNLILIDIANLLFAVQDRGDLRNELISTLSYSVEGIEPCEGFVKVNSLQHSDYTENLIFEMELCQAGKPMARSYEKLCLKLLENIFSEDLALWKEQQKSNNELYRFDLLCRIKDGNQKTFWSILERYFNSKYVIFEFKNYQNPITQKEIYTTEKYLYSKALRSVGIIVTANGYDENASWAAKGCLRENGKLIMLLQTRDIIEMGRMKDRQEDPSNYLLDKLDELLLELEK